MRVLPVFAVTAVTAATALAGCQHLLDGADGISCEYSYPGATAVYIDIDSYDAGPKGDCTVDSGTQVTWRGPPGESRPFTLVFTGSGSGLGWWRGASGHPSREQDGRQKTSVVITGPSGTVHPYEIRVDGQAIDPAIIIR